MRHHLYNPDFQFVREPEEFNKYTDKCVLQYCLGATMYMPGTKDFTDAILNKKYPGLTSMVMCFEDACRIEDVPQAEQNSIHLLDVLSDKLEKGEITYADIPLLIFRVRNLEQFRHFSSMLKPKHIKVLTGINFPKFNAENGEGYFAHLKELNERFGEIIYGMPIIEDKSVAHKETRMAELIGIKQILDRYKDLVLNVRVGATDFSSCFGARRDVDYTIYDIMPVRDILTDILNVFTRDGDYTVSGPVWEYFRINKALKFGTLPKVDLQQSLLRRIPLVNAEVDGLMRELILDKANGFVGKTIIHPSHINYVNGMLAVTREEYEDALQILDTSGGVIKSASANKMNEIGPHHLWAEKVVLRATAYGVIENESRYLELFNPDL
ncbi:MAG: HpcH/HpaI aldolase/citrate lyase family protein [Oscillospiraceae bacterium]|nr:HpcH/HpaI aldolase/citrate lyase family protein [Oscillospiraceae bacterium]